MIGVLLIKRQPIELTELLVPHLVYTELKKIEASVLACVTDDFLVMQHLNADGPFKKLICPIMSISFFPLANVQFENFNGPSDGLFERTNFEN